MIHVHQGDALEILRGIPTASIDSIVTDPPAGIGFMGEDWDSDKGGMEPWVEWLSSILRECNRVLKPGGHALVWGLPRTSFWTALALHQAGFEIRDRVSHLFGSGFPKSLNVSKAIDRAAGATRPVVGANPNHRAISGVNYEGVYSGSNTGAAELTAPATLEAEQWDGWGTALKPAVEDWWLARKPLEERTLARQVLSTGTGALNVDGCRVGGGYGRSESWGRSGHSAQPEAEKIAAPPGVGINQHPEGRWPAHLALSHGPDCIERGDVWQCQEGCAVRGLDLQSGVRTSGTGAVKRASAAGYEPNALGKESSPEGTEMVCYGDTGGASRYFNTFDPDPGSGFLYTPKASRKEREAGLDALPIKSGGELTGREDGSAGLNSPRAGAGRGGGRRNTHPTVKPLALMRWLVRMVTPPGGTVLDPFLGSGSTLVAAVEEGFSGIGVELSEEYVRIALGRILHVGALPVLGPILLPAGPPPPPQLPEHCPGCPGTPC